MDLLSVAAAWKVQEVLDEMGHPGIPLSVISKAAEIQLLYAVDKVILGNRWLRKATGIQPKFPYVIDSFQRKYVRSSIFFCPDSMFFLEIFKQLIYTFYLFT